MNRIILYDRPPINRQLKFHVIISLFEKEDLLGLAIYL